MNEFRNPERLLLTGDTAGGVWTFTTELAHCLSNKGIDVLLATMGPEPEERHRELARRLDIRWEHYTCALEWMENPWEDVTDAGVWLLALAAGYNPDLVHINGYAHASLPWKIPIIVGAHSCVATWWRAVKDATLPAEFSRYRQAVKEALEIADLVIAPTASLLHSMEREYGRIRYKEAIPNGRNAIRFKSECKAPIIFSAGRLWDEAKNIRLLDKIALDLDWPVYVAGENKKKSILHLQCLGVMDEERLADVLSKASIYATPALYEPFGLTILEAALSGCALVLADIPSLREVWGEAAIFLPHDESTWSRTLNWLSNNDNHRRKWADKARKRALQYGVEPMVNRYIAAYRKILGSTVRNNDSRIWSIT